MDPMPHFRPNSQVKAGLIAANICNAALGVKEKNFTGSLTLLFPANSSIISLNAFPGKGVMALDLPDLSLLQHLEGIARQLEIEIRYESLFDDEVSVHSGGCQVRGRHLILIDSCRSPFERARVLARELAKFELEDLYILPRIREFIGLQSSPREKNLPQR